MKPGRGKARTTRAWGRRGVPGFLGPGALCHLMLLLSSALGKVSVGIHCHNLLPEVGVVSLSTRC